MMNTLTKKHRGETMTQTVINIKGMHCASCEVLLTDVLCDIPGVSTAKVSIKTHTAFVDYDSKQTTEQVLRKAIEAEGYETQ